MATAMIERPCAAELDGGTVLLTGDLVVGEYDGVAVTETSSGAVVGDEAVTTGELVGKPAGDCVGEAELSFLGWCCRRIGGYLFNSNDPRNLCIIYIFVVLVIPML